MGPHHASLRDDAPTTATLVGCHHPVTHPEGALKCAAAGGGGSGQQGQGSHRPHQSRSSSCSSSASRTAFSPSAWAAGLWPGDPLPSCSRNADQIASDWVTNGEEKENSGIRRFCVQNGKSLIFPHLLNVLRMGKHFGGIQLANHSRPGCLLHSPLWRCCCAGLPKGRLPRTLSTIRRQPESLPIPPIVVTGKRGKNEAMLKLDMTQVCGAMVVVETLAPPCPPCPVCLCSVSFLPSTHRDIDQCMMCSLCSLIYCPTCKPHRVYGVWSGGSA